MDFAAHNEDVRRTWEAYRAGRPTRVPVTFSLNERMIMLVPELNPAGITPRRYLEDPAAHWELQLAFHRWVRFEVPQDAPMGLPDVWPMGVSLFNVYEAGWFGCELFYPEGDIPDTKPMFQLHKERLHDTPLPDPLRAGIMGRAFEFGEYLDARRQREEFMGRPVASPSLPTAYTDGPLTVACNLRGSTELLEDLVEDEPYFHALLSWVTDGILLRIQAWVKRAGTALPGPDQMFWFADDAIAMLSASAYRQHVMPYHKKILAALHPKGPNGIHLCGAAQHQFPGLVAELGIRSFEVGFPTDMAKARETLGPEIELIGNVHPELLRRGPADAVTADVKRLCASGVMRGGRFILREGNNCAPGTPTSHFAAMYAAAKQFGTY